MLRVFGPSGTEAMHRQLVEDFYRDQAEWAIDLGYNRSGWDDVTVAEVGDRWRIELDGCQVEARTVVHPPMASLGYRCSYQGSSVVVSGDVARCRELVELAAEADVLVVDACAAPPSADAAPQRRALIERLHTFHASPQDCVDMAAEAAVAKVVLTHHLPEAVIDVDTSAYRGEVIVGNDLDVIAARASEADAPPEPPR
jgi:ribonuclease BN (tRNA processing enzyme)